MGKILVIATTAQKNGKITCYAFIPITFSNFKVLELGLLLWLRNYVFFNQSIILWGFIILNNFLVKFPFLMDWWLR